MSKAPSRREQLSVANQLTEVMYKMLAFDCHAETLESLAEYLDTADDKMIAKLIYLIQKAR